MRVVYLRSTALDYVVADSRDLTLASLADCVQWGRQREERQCDQLRKLVSADPNAAALPIELGSAYCGEQASTEN